MASDPALLQPASLTEKSPEVYEVKFSTTKGDFTVQVNARLGADRFRPLLQSRHARILHRCRVLSRGAELHRSVRIERRPGGEFRMARRAHQGRSGDAKQQAGIHHVRHGGSAHAHDAALYQFRQQHVPRRAGLLSVRPGHIRHGRGARSCTAATARSPIRAPSPRKGRLISIRASRISTPSSPRWSSRLGPRRSVRFVRAGEHSRALSS